MASFSSSQQTEQHLTFSGIVPPSKRSKVSESSRLFEVFINHRGPDVKETLARELYNSLQQLGIQTFLDSEEKELGDWFPSAIETAIRSASVHIAIFSKRYAESAWCLAELVLMLESKAKIIPVFYEVKPCDLRYIEKGVYADAFAHYEKKPRYLEKLKEWKEALQTVSFITGDEFNGDCKNTVSTVQKEIQRCKLPLVVAKYPVGLHKLAKDFERRCLQGLVQDFESRCGMSKEGEWKAQIVGIFGMGGAGKTTLSKDLFNQKRSQYARVSFLSDVREHSARRELPSLQKKLIRDLFNEDRHNILSVEDGRSYLKDHLETSSLMKFLIVLDDIDHVEQLDCLCIMDMLNKFVNSLVIVTSRDQRVLVSAGIIAISYNLKGMDREDARELFCWHAFGQADPSSGYKDLVDAFLDMCGGLPLSLQVLGRHVHGTDHKYWSLELNKVRKTLPQDIQQRLKISIEALDRDEKQIFMDVACFFINKSKKMAIRVWEGSGWSAQHALETLKNKCLVEEIKWDKDVLVLRMHDHLRDIGREMADELSHPRRLWRAKDLKSLELMGFQDILAQTKGRCLHSIYDYSMQSGITFFLGESDDIVEMPTSLLWLELHNPVTSDLDHPSIPSWIPLQNLQCLRISHLHLNRLLRSDAQAPSQLKELQICHAILKELPDLFGISNNLKRLVLNAVQMPIEGWTTFCKVTMSGLENLEITGGNAAIKILIAGNHYPSLKSLNLHYMENLIEVDLKRELILPQLNCLERITIENCKNLERVSGISDVTKLVELNISQCRELELELCLVGMKCLESITVNRCGKLKCNELNGLSRLASIRIEYCENLIRVPGIFDITKLVDLNIFQCGELELHELRLVGMNCLERITVVRWGELKCIELNGLSRLESIRIENCENLERVSGISDITKLVELNISKCVELALELCLVGMNCLERITVDACEKLKCIEVNSCRNLRSVSGLSYLTKLVTLNIRDCPELQYLPGLTNLCRLETVIIEGCGKLNSLELWNCQSLKRVSGNLDMAYLCIRDCPELQEPLFVHGRQSRSVHISIVGCGKLQNIIVPRILYCLKLSSCAKLKSVAGICDLTKLYIRKCPELEELSSLTRVCNLERIEIYNCEKLPDIAGVEELRALKHMQLSYCSNTAVQNCIHLLQSVPSEFMGAIGRAHEGAASILNPHLFSEAVGAETVIEILPSGPQSPVEENDGTRFSEALLSSVGENDSTFSLDDDTFSLKAQYLAEEDDGKCFLEAQNLAEEEDDDDTCSSAQSAAEDDGTFFVESPIIAHGGQSLQSLVDDITIQWLEAAPSPIMAELGAIIICALVVVDSSTSVESINKSLEVCCSDTFGEEWFEGFNVHKGEWIITAITTDQEQINNYNLDLHIEDIFIEHGIMKKGCRMTLKKGEEWKTLPILQTIVHSLYEK